MVNNTDCLKFDKLESSILLYIDKHLPKRRAHTLGMRNVALQLASIHKIDCYKVSLACLCHDLGRCLPLSDMREIIKKYYNINIPSYYNTGLAHCYVSAIIAENDFSITDVEILNAIKSHTVGHAEMTIFEKIVYASDYLDPTRGLEQTISLRENILNDFDSTFIEIVLDSIKFIISKKEYLAIETIELYNSVVIKN